MHTPRARLERERTVPSAWGRGEQSARFPIKNDSLDTRQKRGALSPITYLLCKAAEGPIKTA